MIDFIWICILARANKIKGLVLKSDRLLGPTLPARVGGEVMGSLAVIGPTRLDYQHTMSAVSYIARLFDKLLNESE